jgi:hypothetical protein
MFEDQGWKPDPMPIPSARAASRRVWTAATAEYSLLSHRLAPQTVAAGGVLVRKNGEMAARHRAQRTSRIYAGEMRCAAAGRADSEPLTARFAARVPFACLILAVGLRIAASGRARRGRSRACPREPRAAGRAGVPGEHLRCSIFRGLPKPKAQVAFDVNQDPCPPGHLEPVRDLLLKVEPTARATTSDIMRGI